MQRVTPDRSDGPRPFHAAYQEGLARTFEACHAPLPERMQALLQQISEREAMMDEQHEQSLGDASALARYYAGPLPKRG